MRMLKVNVHGKVVSELFFFKRLAGFGGFISGLEIHDTGQVPKLAEAYYCNGNIIFV